MNVTELYFDFLKNYAQKKLKATTIRGYLIFGNTSYSPPFKIILSKHSNKCLTNIQTNVIM